MSVRKFFEKEREKQKSILHDQIVKCTSAACGVGTATVVRNMKATWACCLVLKSDILLQECKFCWTTLTLKQFVKKCMHSMARRNIPHLTACLIINFLKTV